MGFIWYIYKGMWGWGIIALILAIATWGISWLVFSFFANAQHSNSLLKQGYLNEIQWNEKQQADSNTINSGTRQTVSSVADELAKLAALKEQGVLSDDEFSRRKSKLLS